jgi:Tat protein translocase TatB subunit
MFGLGMTEVVLILAIALVVLGPDRLPGMAKAAGRAMREFRKATREIRATLEVEEVRRTIKESVMEETVARSKPVPRNPKQPLDNVNAEPDEMFPSEPKTRPEPDSDSDSEEKRPEPGLKEYLYGDRSRPKTERPDDPESADG